MNIKQVLLLLRPFDCRRKKILQTKVERVTSAFFLLIPPPAPLPHLTSLENRVIRPLYLLSHDKKDFPEKNGIVRWLKIFWQYPYT